MSEENNGIERAPLNPGWIKKRVPDSYADDGLKRIIMFYVINTPCTDLSSSGIAVTEYGWNKDVWKKEALKSELMKTAKLKRGTSFVVAKKLDEMKKSCETAKLKKGFHQSRNVERVVFYKNKGNDCLSLFSHIRNALAHGRLAMYPCGNKDTIFAMEDGIKRNGEFHVRSRMILKKSTLLSWIDIIQAGRLNNNGKTNC